MTEAPFCVPIFVAHDHPCLPGHFPGAPIVPGVVLLEHVADALRAWRGERLARIVEVKFLAPLRPAEQAQLRLHASGGRIRFEIEHAAHVIARGVLEGAA